MSTETERGLLLSCGIFEVTEAARAVGYSFRNGEKKAEIVDALIARGLQGKALAYINTKRSNKAHTPTPSPDGYSPQTTTATTEAPSAMQTPNNEAAQLAAVLQSILSRPQGLDVPAVQALIDAALKNIDVGFSTTINIPDRPQVVIEERTHAAFPSLMRKLSAGENVMIVGDAGTGKTHACEQAAKALGLTLHVQGAVSYAHELLGYKTATGEYLRTPTREAFEHGGLLLIDEADASAPEAPLVINSLLANGFAAFPDALVKKHPDFICVLNTNVDGSGATMQYSGRVRMDGAFLDRFVMQRWAIDPAIEKDLACGQLEWLAAVRAVREYVKTHQIADVIATPRAVTKGARLLAAGETREEVLTACLMRGALVDQWANICALGPVSDFLAGF
jgi:cobaltochelatase CobS